MLDQKTKRYTMRLTPAVFKRLNEMAQELGTPLPDLLTIGAMAFHARAIDAPGYLQEKAGFLVSQIRRAFDAPLEPNDN